MKTAKILASLVLALCFAMTSAWAAGEAKDSKIVTDQNIKETKIIRLDVLGGIHPAEVTVKPGTTVVWVNDSRSQLELKFEGKQVTLACKSPVHFLIDEDGSFISDRIPQDSVASLCFVEKGEFSYVLRKVATGGAISQPRDNIKEFKGKVIVQ
jgi:plastocyanin